MARHINWRNYLASWCGQIWIYPKNLWNPHVQWGYSLHHLFRWETYTKGTQNLLWTRSSGQEMIPQAPAIRGLQAINSQFRAKYGSDDVTVFWSKKFLQCRRNQRCTWMETGLIKAERKNGIHADLERKSWNVSPNNNRLKAKINSSTMKEGGNQMEKKKEFVQLLFSTPWPTGWKQDTVPQKGVCRLHTLFHYLLITQMIIIKLHMGMSLLFIWGVYWIT